MPAPPPDHPFRCEECRLLLAWEAAEVGSVLVCGNPQCAAAGLPVTVSAAQRQRTDRGEDLPAPGPGWPRPKLAGLPVPYLLPVTDGQPWWRLTDTERVIACQQQWRCQVCGLGLPDRAWVVLDGRHIDSDTAVHRRCLNLALAHCPHLRRGRGRHRHTDVTRAEIHAEDLTPTPYGWRQRWSLPPEPSRPRKPLGA